MTLGDVKKAPWLDTSNDKKIINDWRIATSRGHETPEKLQSRFNQLDNSISKAQMMMITRRDLGELAGWRGPTSAEAIALARAIEITMDALFDFQHKLPLVS